MLKRLPITFRIFVTLIAIFAFVVAGIAFILYAQFTTTVQAAVLGNVNREMALLARDFDAWLSSKVTVVESLARGAYVLKDAPDRFLRMLVRESAADRDIASMYFGTKRRGGAAAGSPGIAMTEDGGYYLDSSLWSPGPGYDWTKAVWWKAAASKAGIVVSEPYVDPATDNLIISLSESSQADDGSIFGVVSCDVKVSRLSELVAVRRFTPNSRTVLVQTDGAYIGGASAATAGNATGDVPNFFSGDSPVAAVRDQIKSVERSAGIVRGEDRFYTSARMPRTGWFLIAYGPVRDITGPIDEFLRSLVMVCIGALLLAALFAFVESHYISDPIERLKKGALELAGGNLSYRVDIRSGDEFGELGAFFNLVAENLALDIRRIEAQRHEISQYSQNLERKVAERTSELDEANALLRMRNSLMEEEMEMAAAVQRKIIPQATDFPVARELSFGARYLAMANVGGDLYDVIEIDDRNFGFLIGDVSGHGIAAALIAAMAKVSVRTKALPGRDAARVLSDVNDDLCELVGSDSYFLSAFLAILDVSSGRVDFSNAGHHPALLRRKGGGIERLDVQNGQLLGLSGGFAFESGRSVLEPGDRLVLYTDGITESRSVTGAFYDEDRLVRCLSSATEGSSEDFVDTLFDDLDTFGNGAEQSDDQAVLAVDFLALRTGSVCFDPGTSPSLPDRIDVAKRLLEADDAKEAIALLENLRRKNPENPEIMNLMGMARYRLGDIHGARRLLETAVCLAPSIAEYLGNLDLVQSTEKTTTENT